MHFPRAIVNGVRRRGVDILTSQDANMETASDPEQLEFARQQGRVLVTHDADFLRLHAAGSVHAGIVFIRQRRGGVGELIAGLVETARLAADQVAGTVTYL